MLDVLIYGFAMTALAVALFFIVLLLKAKQYEGTGEPTAAPVKKRRPVIVEVKYMGPVGTEVKTGGLGGAMVGGFLFGDAGAIVGGMAPKGSRTLTRFAVKYDNGRVKVEDCYSNSMRYDELMSYVRWDDL